MPSNSCNTIKIIPPNLLYLTWPNTRGGGFCKVLGVDITSITNRNTANKSLGFLRRNLQTKNPELRELTRRLSSPSWCMLLQSGTPPPTLDDIQKNNQDGSEVGSSVGLRWLLTLLKYLRHAGKTRLAYPWAAACWQDWSFSTKYYMDMSQLPLPSYVILLTHISWTSHLLAHRQSYTRTTTTSTHFFPWHLFSEQSPGPHCQPDRPW